VIEREREREREREQSIVNWVQTLACTVQTLCSSDGDGQQSSALATTQYVNARRWSTPNTRTLLTSTSTHTHARTQIHTQTHTHAHTSPGKPTADDTVCQWQVVSERRSNWQLHSSVLRQLQSPQILKTRYRVAEVVRASRPMVIWCRYNVQPPSEWDRRTDRRITALLYASYHR